MKRQNKNYYYFFLTILVVSCFSFFILVITTTKERPADTKKIFIEQSSADNSTALVPINNAAPTVSNTSVNSGATSIDLIQNGIISLTCSGTITDLNSCSDIQNASYVFYRTSVEGGTNCTASANNCYRGSCSLANDCTAQDITQTATCSIQLQDTAEATDGNSIYEDTNWTCKITPSDTTQQGTSDSDTIEVNTLIITPIVRNLSAHITPTPTNTTGGGSAAQTTETPQTEEVPAVLIVEELKNIQVKNITETSAEIYWETTFLSNTILEMRVSTSKYNSLEYEDAELKNAHFLLLENLLDNQTYSFKIKTSSALVISEELDFTTLKDTTPPGNISALDIRYSPPDIILTWLNPDDIDFFGVELYRNSADEDDIQYYPIKSGSSLPHLTGNFQTFTDKNVTQGKIYYYTIFTFDDAANFSSGEKIKYTLILTPETQSTTGAQPQGVGNDTEQKTGNQKEKSNTDVSNPETSQKISTENTGEDTTPETQEDTIISDAETIFEETGNSQEQNKQNIQQEEHSQNETQELTPRLYKITTQIYREITKIPSRVENLFTERIVPSLKSFFGKLFRR